MTAELLAPAGNLETGKAVLDAGADAVYGAGESFGARAYAKNLSMAECAELIRFAHLRNKRVHIAFNTLLKDHEMEREAYDCLRAYYEMGVDAVILQDFGLVSLVRDHFPDLPIHCSTQMNVTSPHGAAFLRREGAKRIILARELSVPEISRIHESCEIELEAFVHGALCVCYSGQCLMSSMIGGRSGNRGRCAQPCRQPYGLFAPDGSRIKTAGEYLLSPKDLCAIRDLPRLIRAGVCSLKIEGRMKSRTYAETVVSLYRTYLDLLAEKGPDEFRVSQEDWRRLLAAGNRSGFTALFLDQKNGRDLMAMKSPKHQSSPVKASVKPEKKRQLPGRFSAVSGKPLSFAVSLNGEELSVYGGPCEPARKRETTASEIMEKLRKTGDLPFGFEAVSVHAGAGVFVPMKAVNALRHEMIREIETRLLAGELRRPALPFAPNVPRDAVPAQGGERVYARVRTAKQLAACLVSGMVDCVIVPPGLARSVRQCEKDVIYALPTVVRGEDEAQITGFVREHPNASFEADGFDALGLLISCGVSPKRIFGGIRLYALSGRTRQAFCELGGLSVPAELSRRELAHRTNRGDRMIVYGRIPLMITASCIRKNTVGCDREGGFYRIRDRRGMEFPVLMDCPHCQNIIFNSVPTDLRGETDSLRKLDITHYEYDFTFESGEEVSRILAGGGLSPHTKGHFNRGVE